MKIPRVAWVPERSDEALDVRATDVVVAGRGAMRWRCQYFVAATRIGARERRRR